MTAEPTLGQLIDERRGKRSYEELARDCGGTPGPARLQQLARRPLKNFPDPDSIKSIARGLGVSVTAVVMACSRSVGLRVHVGDDPYALVIGRAGILPDGPRQVVVDVAREMLDLFDPHHQIVDVGIDQHGQTVYLTREDVEGATPTEDEVPGATKADDLIIRQNPIIPSWTDATTAEGDAEVAQQQVEMEEDLFSRYLAGERGFDEVTERRFRQRVQDEEPRAARRGESTADRMREQADADAERPDDPGPDDGV